MFYVIVTVSESGTVKVADFGTSKLVSVLAGEAMHAGPGEQPTWRTALATTSLDASFALTRAVGTLAWMAPEVLDGDRYGLPADVYSYGIVLWEVATQQLPWLDKQHSWDIANAVQAGERPDMTEVPPGHALAALMLRCWQADPHARPTFDAVLQALGN